MKVAVLGCGPAGLIAAYGAREAGASVRLISGSRTPSDLYGCQYLHEPIPGITKADPVEMRYKLVGTAEGYRRKVYGEGADIVAVSPNTLEENHLAWDLRWTYRQLWERLACEEEVETVHLSRKSARRIAEHLAREEYQVVCTIPRYAVCQHDRHVFLRALVYARGDAPALARYASPEDDVEPNTVVCNGDQDVAWYRTSNVFGHSTVEWSLAGIMFRPPGASLVHKPVATNCNCFPHWRFAGRYGTWTKGVLSHEAFRVGVEAAA